VRSRALSACAFEGLDDDHAATAAWAWTRRGGRIGVARVIEAAVLTGLRGNREPAAREGYIVRADGRNGGGAQDSCLQISLPATFQLHILL